MNSRQLRQLHPFAEGLISVIGSDLEKSPNGSYHIPGISLAEWQNPQVRLLAGLMTELVYRYPQYVWRESEALFNPNGITVHWTRKPQALSQSTPKDTWWWHMDSRGRIRGDFSLPIFTQAMKAHNKERYENSDNW